MLKEYQTERDHSVSYISWSWLPFSVLISIRRHQQRHCFLGSNFYSSKASWNSHLTVAYNFKNPIPAQNRNFLPGDEPATVKAVGEESFLSLSLSYSAQLPSLSASWPLNFSSLQSQQAQFPGTRPLRSNVTIERDVGVLLGHSLARTPFSPATWHLPRHLGAPQVGPSAWTPAAGCPQAGPPSPAGSAADGRCQRSPRLGP